MNWLQKLASPESWLRQQGIADDIILYALDNNKFPRKMQKWVAIQLHKKFKSDPDLRNINTPQDFDFGLIEVRDWFNHMSRTEHGFDISRYTMKDAVDAALQWQQSMADIRGEGHAREYTQPDYNAEELGNGFRMVEVVSDDLENEGAIMQHCVGDDTQDYREKVESGKSMIFSLRDSRGWPHATIEIQNENDFDIDEFDNDPENWIYDEAGNMVDIDYEAAGDRQAHWAISQIQGKQNEPPVNKYRPFLKTWLENHPEFNPSENDLLSVTPSPELLQTIMNIKGQTHDRGIFGQNSLYKKYSRFLDEEDQVRLIGQIINDQGVGWSNDAISDAISKPFINEWFDESNEESAAAGVMNREKHNAFVRSLTIHDSPDIRRAAYSRMSADSYYRTPEGLQEFMQVALQEPSAKVVAVILPNFFTYPNKDSTDSIERYRNPIFSPDLFPFAMQLSENFKGAPGSQELHSKIVTGLAPQGDPQMIAQAVTNQFVGQQMGDGSTYELRHALESMDTPRFGQVWALLDPILRRFMLSEEIKGYNLMVSKHREVIDKYPGESAMRSSNGGLAPPGHGEIFQPEDVQDISETQNQGLSGRDKLETTLLNQFKPVLPSRNAVSNWLQKIASVEIMYHGTSVALAPKILSEGLVPGRELVWDKEKTKEDIHSRESYGGIYFSDNFMTAFMAARTSTDKFGEGRLMVMAQLEMRSPHILMDEDKTLEPRRVFDRVLGVVSNGWFYCSWIKEGMPRLGDITEGYLDELSTDLNKEVKPGFEDPRQREALTFVVSELIKTSAIREAAIAMQEDSTLHYQFPEFENLTVAETESNYRNAANELMNKTKFLANVESSFSHNVRSLEPISYRGTNKIVLVAKMNESTYDYDARKSHYIEDKYNLEAEILYVSDKSVISILTEDMVQRIGGGIRVRDNYGKVYFEQPRKEMAA